MEVDKLSSLQYRIQKLERLLYSDDPKNHSTSTIAPILADYDRRVKDVEKSNNTLKKVYSQLEDLEKFALMCNADTIEKSTAGKKDFIEASEGQLRQQAKHLESVEKLKWVLDSEHLKSRVTSNLNVKVLQISQRQADQREEVVDELAQTKQLADNYNQALSAVSNQFEKWNAFVTKLEEQQSIVKD